MLLFFSLLGGAYAQNKIFEFSDELCSYRGYYDAEKYSASQLRDSYALFQTGHYIDDSGTGEELKMRYDSAIETLNNLQPVNNDYFKRLKVDVLNYVKQTYALKIVQKNAKQQPAALVTAVEEGSRAHYYGTALHAGGEVLMKAYLELVRDQMKENAWPESLWDNYQESLKQPNKEDLAFDYVLVYGWWNNANRLVAHIDYDGTQMEKFMALFVKVDTLDCDEP